MIGRETLRAAMEHRLGFLTAEELATVARDEHTCMDLVLVRCNAGRFLAPANQAQHFIDIVTREGADHVRDVSIPATKWRG